MLRRDHKHPESALGLTLKEMTAHELWLHNNPKVLKTVQNSLKKKGKHSLGSFAKYLNIEEL